MTISAEVADAIDNARGVRAGDEVRLGSRHHGISFDRVRAIVLAVVRELPDGMSIAELRDELEIAENQEER